MTVTRGRVAADMRMEACLACMSIHTMEWNKKQDCVDVGLIDVWLPSGCCSGGGREAVIYIRG